MKRILLNLIGLLLIANLATGESIDFSSMEFDDLAKLKHDLDLEYNSRPELMPYGGGFCETFHYSAFCR